MGSIEERSIVTPIREMAYGSLTDRGLPLRAPGLDGLWGRHAPEVCIRTMSPVLFKAVL